MRSLNRKVLTCDSLLSIGAANFFPLEKTLDEDFKERYIIIPPSINILNCKVCFPR